MPRQRKPIHEFKVGDPVTIANHYYQNYTLRGAAHRKVVGTVVNIEGSRQQLIRIKFPRSCYIWSGWRNQRTINERADAHGDNFTNSVAVNHQLVQPYNLTAEHLKYRAKLAWAADMHPM